MRPPMRAAFIYLLLVAAPLPLSAQARRANVPCDSVPFLLQAGPKGIGFQRAAKVMPTCGQQARTAIATSIRTLRQSSDSAELSELHEVADTWKDGAIFEAALTVAADRTASARARVHAFSYLLRLRSPYNGVSYQQLAAGLDANGLPREGCGNRRNSESGFYAGGSPLPGDWATRRRAIARRVFEDKTEPTEVRSAAACAY
jgi:hypothetical protein